MITSFIIHDPDAPELPCECLNLKSAHNWRTANSNDQVSRADEKESGWWAVSQTFAQSISALFRNGTLLAHNQEVNTLCVFS